MNDVLKTISHIGVIPVIAIDDAKSAVPLAQALERGGLPAAEVTFRTAAGEESIHRIANECPGVLVGAGTVLNVEQAERALAAGAKFIVSPGYNEALVQHCVKKNVPVLPGCVNASDMTRAVNDGLSAVKFFPAGQSGGVEALKGLAPVFPQLDFMPTGGVNAKNLMDYLGFDRIFACGGTWMVKKDLINGAKWDEIEALCREAVAAMLGFTLRHVGVNCPGGAGEAESTAKAMAAVFGLGARVTSKSSFTGDIVEFMNGQGPGVHGHIAIGTNSVERAIYHLGRRGVEFKDETLALNEKGRPKFIYLKESFGGFGVHLILK